MTAGPNANEVLAEAMRALIECGAARIYDQGIRVLNARTIELDGDAVSTLRAVLTDDGMIAAHDPPAGQLGAFDAQFRRLCQRHNAVAAFVCADSTGTEMRFGGHPALCKAVFDAMSAAALAHGQEPGNVVPPPDPSLPSVNGRLWTPGS